MSRRPVDTALQSAYSSPIKYEPGQPRVPKQVRSDQKEPPLTYDLVIVTVEISIDRRRLPISTQSVHVEVPLFPLLCTDYLTKTLEPVELCPS